MFIHDALIRKMWVPKGKRPLVTVTGSHQKTCVFGTLTIDGKQLFRQYKTFDQYSFISYLRELKRRFHKLILFLDRAPQHCRSKKVKAYLDRNSDTMIIEFLPKGSPNLSAIEECWRQGKSDLLLSNLSQIHKPKNSYCKLLYDETLRLKHQILDERVHELMLMGVVTEET